MEINLSMELENGNLHVSSNGYSGANEIDFVCAYHLLILFFIKKKIVTYFKVKYHAMKR